ncbi:DoxX family protein [Bdellovibrio sp. qaytius]|nr:DoxX family protein [Bdellovibrio sp. qaytius]
MKSKIFLLLRLVVAGILLQTLYFKFSGAPESIYIFSTLKVEPWGRWFAGFSELVASILILIPATQVFGALMAAGIMAGAILSHLFVLGVVVQDDSGLLFTLACVVFVLSNVIIFDQRQTLLNLVKKIRG